MGSFQFIESNNNGDNGNTSLQLQKPIPQSEAMYLFVFRFLDGVTEVHPPIAWLAYIRPNGWNRTIIGEQPSFWDRSEIKDGKFTFYFKSKQWARVWVYLIGRNTDK